VDHSLVEALARGGHAPHEVLFPDGTEVLVLPHGGRVLGLFPSGEDRNVLWTHPRLAADARAFFATSGWHNPGGERTWLAPEIDFFFPRYPDRSEYVPPQPFDAGEFDYQAVGGQVRLTGEFRLPGFRSRRPAAFRLHKHLAAAPNPVPDLGGIRFAGYAVTAELERLPDDPGEVEAGLWSLTQLPHGGEMLVPLRGRAGEPRIFFGAPGPGDVRVTAGALRYRMSSEGEHKIGLRPRGLTGRAGHWLEGGAEAQLVVREFSADPSARYPDGPPADESDTGYAFEACSVAHPVLGRFNELEQLAPALAPDQARCADTARLWAFRGAVPAVRAAAVRLLGLSP
jgi:hypothetical protein